MIAAGPAAQLIGPHKGGSEADIAMAAALMDRHLKACRTYADSHGGEWPDSTGGLPGWLVYVKPSARDLEADAASRTVVMHETFDAWDTGAIVGFADTKLRVVRDEAEFRRLLAEASDSAE